METFSPRAGDRRLAALGVTAALHALLILGWQAMRQLPPRQPDAPRMAVQWLTLPAKVPPSAPAAPIAPQRPAHAVPSHAAGPALPALPVVPVVPAPAAAPPTQPDTAAAPAPQPEMGLAPAPTVRELMERGRHGLGSILRAMKKDAKPVIVAPPDSPQIRLRKGIEQAAEMAPNHWWQAPKTAELVNNTGDGARRTRVITGTGTYCITERAPTTSIDMIEKHGKLRVTSCPEHEAPADPQE